MATTGRPQGFYSLSPGTEYIELNGIAIPLTNLEGERQGQVFYPDFSESGYMIRKREMTNQERHTDVKSRMVPASQIAAPTIDLSDWK